MRRLVRFRIRWNHLIEKESLRFKEVESLLSERLWGSMHRIVTHNRSYEKFNDFRTAVLTFLRVEVPENWHLYCDSVTDNFRIINPADFRVLKA